MTLKKQSLLSAEIWNSKGAPNTHAQKGGPGSSQAVLEAGGRESAAVMCWLDSLFNEHHLGLQEFWWGGSILLPVVTPLVTDTVLSSEDQLFQMCIF